MENTSILPYMGLQITEEEYRALPQISYSLISDYIKSGHEALYNREDKKRTIGLNTGSLLDIMLTKTEDIKNVAILEKENYPSEQIQSILKYFIDNSPTLPEDILNPTNEESAKLLAGAMYINYGQNWKTDTILSKIVNSGNEFYKIAIKRTKNPKLIIVTQDIFESVSDAAATLKSNDYVKEYFIPSSNEIVFYDQVKLISNIYNIKGMLDRVVINYKHKTITPIDFKYSAFKEREFPNAVYTGFNYDIQSNLYSYLLREFVNNCPELQGFEIKNFKFIVINPDNLAPLIFETPYFEPEQTLYFKNSLKIRKSWLIYYNEMSRYENLEFSPYTLEETENNGIIFINSLTANINE